MLYVHLLDSQLLDRKERRIVKLSLIELFAQNIRLSLPRLQQRK